VRPVLALIFHPAAPPDAGPLVCALAEARLELAERQRAALTAAGADTTQIVAGPPDEFTFGERLAAALRLTATAVLGEAGEERPSYAYGGRGPAGSGDMDGDRAAMGQVIQGLIVLGSGSIPLARPSDLRRFVEVAAGPGGHALANNRYSADVVAVSRAADLAGLPPLPADNALPRWLDERAGVAVADLRSRWRLGVDIDSPLDLILLRDSAARNLRAAAPLVGERLAALADVTSNRRAELLVAGRVSASTLAWLERGVACRVRALVEERGLRAASALAQSGGVANSRPPRSILGELLNRDGPGSLAATVAQLADAAVIDTRVLLAHRLDSNDRAWPEPEDRYASDLLLPGSIADPWLRDLTASATMAAPAGPILLGGHTLVNGGLRLLAERARAGAR